MKIKLQGFISKAHSWSVCHWALANEFKKLGHTVHMFSTDGPGIHMPNNLKENLIGYIEENKPEKLFGRMPDANYDMQLSYTAMRNFNHYLKYGNKNRFGVWCYEWVSNQNKDILPKGFTINYKYADKILAPSTYVKDLMFKPAKIPESHLKVIPHGIDVESFRQTSVVELPTNKTFKILVNCAQTHLRKNIRGILNAYGKAFTKHDDVCLIFKAKDRKPEAPFDVSISNEIKLFKEKYKNHAEIKLFDKFIPDISSLYRSVNCLFSLSHGEGFLIPGIEALAAGKLVIAPTLGGHRDFINKDNALLVESKFVRADPKSMYWNANSFAEQVLPDEEHASIQLKEAYKTYKDRNKILEAQREEVYTKYSWENISKQIISLCK